MKVIVCVTSEAVVDCAMCQEGLAALAAEELDVVVAITVIILAAELWGNVSSHDIGAPRKVANRSGHNRIYKARRALLQSMPLRKISPQSEDVLVALLQSMLLAALLQSMLV